MHILTRKSSLESTSHALAWHTTSRSAGLVKSERSQKVCGSGGKPSDRKKFSPYFTMPRGSVLRSCRIFVRSKLCAGFGESIRSYTLFHSCAQRFPSRCAEIGPFGGTTVLPYFFASWPRTYACSDKYSGRNCSHSRSSSLANASGGLS